jgi:transcriptional regulator with XRE-family HTH domain
LNVKEKINLFFKIYLLAKMGEKHKVGERIKEVANKKYEGNISALARHLGMSPQSFNKYAQGDTMPGGKVLKRLISIDINLNWLLLGIEPMLISDIKQAEVSKIGMVKEEETPSEEDAGKYVEELYSGIDLEDLNQTEREFLEEVKQFSLFLEERDLNPQVKRLLLELLIQSIDQALEQPPHDQPHNRNQ